jgi:hypothetical protein
VIGYSSGPPARVFIDNQWGSQSDHTGHKSITVEQLFLSMRQATDTSQIHDLEQHINRSRANKQFNYPQELNLLRLKYHAGALREDDFNSQLNQKIKEIQKHSMDTGEAVSHSTRVVLRSLVGMQAWDKRLQSVHLMHDIGMSDEARYDRNLANQMAQIRLQQQQAVKEGTFNFAREQEYRRAAAEFWKLVRELPKERRAAILESVDRQLNEK